MLDRPPTIIGARTGPPGEKAQLISLSPRNIRDLRALGRWTKQCHPLALVVDDEGILRLFAAGLLEEHGFDGPHPDLANPEGATNIRPGAYARGASRLDERGVGDGGRARRPCACGASPDRRGGARGRSQRRAWTGTLRARRGRQSRLSQRLSTGQDEDGGGRRGLFGSASPGHA